MESKDLNPAREEYFDKLDREFQAFYESSNETHETQAKDRILSMTYDKNEALQKRVEELEEELDKYVELSKTYNLTNK